MSFVIFCIAYYVIYYLIVSFSGLPRFEEEELIFLLSITRNFVVFCTEEIPRPLGA